MVFIVKRDAPRPIWKIAIFGAGSIDSNSEYVWDGVTITNGEREYFGQALRIIFDFDNYWKIYDSGNDNMKYISLDLITWSTENGDNPPPSSALSYSQGSYIQTVVLADGSPDQSGTYTWDGTTFVNGRPKYMGPLKSGASQNNYIYWTGFEYSLYGWHSSNEEMVGLSSSIDLASDWGPNDAPSPPTVSSIVYTA